MPVMAELNFQQSLIQSLSQLITYHNWKQLCCLLILCKPQCFSRFFN